MTGDGVANEPQTGHIVGDIRRALLDLTHKLFVDNGFGLTGHHELGVLPRGK